MAACIAGTKVLYNMSICCGAAEGGGSFHVASAADLYHVVPRGGASQDPV